MLETLVSWILPPGAASSVKTVAFEDTLVLRRVCSGAGFRGRLIDTTAIENTEKAKGYDNRPENNEK